MSKQNFHEHDSEEVIHESESLNVIINETRARLKVLENQVSDLEWLPGKIDDLISKAKSDQKVLDKLNDTALALNTIVGILAEEAGYEVIVDGNTTTIIQKKP